MADYEGETEKRDWMAAKEFVRNELVKQARRNELISFLTIIFHLAADPSLPAFNLANLLLEITVDEHREGRGLLTALAVPDTDGDHLPDEWFFVLARKLGYEFDDKREFWIQERDRIFSMYAQ